MNTAREKSPDRPGSVSPVAVTFLLRFLYAACAISVALEFLIHRHEGFAFAESFGFYAWFTIGISMALVLLAKLLRRLTMRHENYYDGEAP